MTDTTLDTRAFRAFTSKHFEQIPQLRSMSRDGLRDLQAVAAVLPFRVNTYVLDELIDWDDVPGDPLFQLTFPQPGMLAREDFERMRHLIVSAAPEQHVREAAREIQWRLNPHPAGQLDLNVPILDGELRRGLQHKYRETVLFFPAQGQTCHSYCTYCFRWAQFVGIDELKFVDSESDVLVRYLRAHPEVSDVLFTGGDPMVMRTHLLRRYVEPLLAPELENLTTIRFGTKAPAYWPHRFVTDPDADDLLRLFEQIVASGRHLAVMAHYSHPRELEPAIAREALRRIRSTGAVVRCQAPLIRHVNDDASLWAEMWQRQVQLGAVPYYMFVERDTGAKRYFEVPLAQAFEIFRDAYQQCSGIARTVRGPSMSATPGKVLIDGVAEIDGDDVFVLKFLQARNPAWVNRVFFARYDEAATWLHDLRPAFGEDEFFFEEWLRSWASRREAAVRAVRRAPPAKLSPARRNGTA
jgi:L-lysine 2,3-aminomutase